MIKALYNCSADDMYLALNYGWDLTEQNLDALQAYKNKYNPAFVKTNRADIRTAEDLPDQVSRYAPTQAQRVDLIAKKEEVLDYYQYLVGYIEDAYRADKIKIKTQAAGQAKYTKAYSNNWTSVKALLSAAILFIEENQADLIANDNMPTDFLKRFKGIRAEFDAAYKAWNTEDSDSYNLTDEKTKANNACYSNFLGVTSDVQKVFRKDPVMVQKFTFAALLAQVSGISAAGVGGKVVIEGTKTVIANGTVTIASLDKTVKTGADGRFDISPIAAGFYTLRVEAEGYELFVLENYEVKTGTIGRLKIEMRVIEVKVTASELVLA